MTDDAPRLRKRPGPPKGTGKGVHVGGRKKGTPNRATLERDRKAELDRQRLAELEAAAARGASAIEVAGITGRKLMKETGFELVQLTAGLVAYYQPWPQWIMGPDGKIKNANPNFDEAKFDKYLVLAMNGARDFAAYESPKLAAVMLAQGLVGEIQIIGGLPDEEDGGLKDAPDGYTGVTIEVVAVELKPGASGAGATAAGAQQGAGDGPMAPQGAGPAIPDPGKA